MKKRHILLGLALAATAVFSLASCGSDEENTDTASAETAASNTAASATETPSTETPSAETTSTGKKEKEYEEVTYSCIAEQLDTGTIDKIVGQYTLKGEVRGRTKTWVDPDNAENTKTWTKSFKNTTFTFTAPGNGTLTMYIQNGSSSAKTQQIAIENNKTGDIEKITFSGTEAVEPYGGGSPVVKIDYKVKAGTEYEMHYMSGTVDWYELDMTCTVEKSDVTGFQLVDAGDVDFIVGEAFSAEDIAINKVYGNGRTESMKYNTEGVKIDSSAYDPSKAGTYTIYVKYNDYEAQSYTVNVWEVKSIALGFNRTYQGSNSAAGNSQYINGKVKKIYAVGESLDTTNLSITATAELNGDTKDFLLNSRSAINSVKYSTVDTSTAGKKDVTVTYGTCTANYSITVVDAAYAKNADGEYLVNVDASYTGIAGAVDETKGNQFATIGEALEFLSRSDVDADTIKVINVAAGTYKEKLEINIPNLIIIGANEDTTMIEWDSLYGTPDESGYLQNTDSTTTVAVRDTAVNCTIRGITISNWWNSEERFQSKIDYLKENGLYTTKVNEHRALALLVQSDKFYMQDCKLLGYQDTVEFMKGRQYLLDVYIAGSTDYIFGTNNTTFFDSCEIHAIYNGSTDGGYTTAFKGNNKNASDAVTYGAIFYRCNFTADEEVADGNTALGRPWGAYAAVATIECNFDDHISMAASTGASKNERYVAMTVPATESTVKFVEYGNDGGSAIYETQAGMTYLDSDTALNYCDFTIIFGTTNGGVTYTEAWDPTK